MEKTFWRNQISKKKEGVPETLAPSRDFAAKRQVELNEMYEQCFSIELKPWRKPSVSTALRKKGGVPKTPRLSGLAAKRRNIGLNEMYEQCFSMELKPWRKLFDY